MKRLVRFQGRHSYKPSEVLGLFVISLFFGMFVYGLCLLLNEILDSAIRWWSGTA